MAITGWYTFRPGENITATLLNEKLQDTIIAQIDAHGHTVEAEDAYTTSDNVFSGPMIWADFIRIDDVATRINSANLSALDHVRDPGIHNSGETPVSSVPVTSGKMAFQVLHPDDWEWKGQYWEQEVSLPDSFGFQDCNYIVYFQPVYPSDYVTFYGKLTSNTANFHTLQGICPMNHTLLDYNIMSTEMKSGGFKVRLYALGTGTRYGLVKYPEKLFIQSDWDVNRIMDGRFEKPTQIQAIDNRLYVLSSSNKIVVFNNATGEMMDVISPPVITDSTSLVGNTIKWDSIFGFAVCAYVLNGIKRYACVINCYSKEIENFYTYIYDGDLSGFIRIPGTVNYTGELCPNYSVNYQNYSKSDITTMFVGPYLDGGCKQPIFNVETSNVLDKYIGGARSINSFVDERACEAPQIPIDTQSTPSIDGVTVDTDLRLNCLASWLADSGYINSYKSSGIKVTGYYDSGPVTRWYQIWVSAEGKHQTVLMNEGIGSHGLAQGACNPVALPDNILTDLLVSPSSWNASGTLWFKNEYLLQDAIVETYSNTGSFTVKGIGGVKGFRSCIFDTAADVNGVSTLGFQSLNTAGYISAFSKVEIKAVDAATNSVAYRENGKYYLEPVGLFDWASWYTDLQKAAEVDSQTFPWFGMLSADRDTSIHHVIQNPTIGTETDGVAPVDFKYRLRIELPGEPISVSGFRLPDRWVGGAGGTTSSAQIAYFFVWMKMPSSADQQYGLRCYMAARFADGYQVNSGLYNTGKWLWYQHQESPSHILSLTPPVDALMDITSYGDAFFNGVFYEERDLSSYILPWTSPRGHLTRNISKDPITKQMFYNALLETLSLHVTPPNPNGDPLFFNTNPLNINQINEFWQDTVGLSGGTIGSPLAMTDALTEIVSGTSSLKGISEFNPQYIISDIFATIARYPDDVTSRDYLHNIQLYLADYNGNGVYAYHSNSVIDDEIDGNNYYRIGAIHQDWVLDITPPEPGVFKGFVSVDGSQATYSSDYPVISLDSATVNSSDTVAYQNFYDGMDWLHQRFNRWPSTRSRYARYNIVGPALIENGDHLNGISGQNNPITEMSFICYVRPLSYEDKLTPISSFTFDPRYISQVAVDIYDNKDGGEYGDSAVTSGGVKESNQSYLAYSPKLINNAYVLGNTTNELNTMINTSFLISNSDATRIDIFMDLATNGQSLLSYYRIQDTNREVVQTFTPTDLYTMSKTSTVGVDNYLKSWDDWASTPWNSGDNDKNVSAENFLLGALLPTSSLYPAGWNWVMFAPIKDGTSWKFSPKVKGYTLGDDESEDWFSITLSCRSDTTIDLGATDSGLLSPTQVLGYGFAEDLTDAATKFIYRLTLNLGDKFRNIITSACQNNGLETGTAMPFAPTIHCSDAPHLGVYRRSNTMAGSIGIFNNNTSMSSYAYNTAGQALDGPINFDTVQLYDKPLAGGGLWLSILSAPLTMMPRYLSRYIFGDETISSYGINTSTVTYDTYRQLGGIYLPNYYAVKQGQELIYQTGAFFGKPYDFDPDPYHEDMLNRFAAREMSLNNRLIYSDNITRMFLLKDFKYYQILRAINIS